MSYPGGSSRQTLISEFRNKNGCFCFGCQAGSSEKNSFLKTSRDEKFLINNSWAFLLTLNQHSKYHLLNPRFQHFCCAIYIQFKPIKLRETRYMSFIFPLDLKCIYWAMVQAQRDLWFTAPRFCVLSPPNRHPHLSAPHRSVTLHRCYSPLHGSSGEKLGLCGQISRCSLPPVVNSWSSLH